MSWDLRQPSPSIVSSIVSEGLCGLLAEVTSGSSYRLGKKKSCNTEVCWQRQEHPFFAFLLPRLPGCLGRKKIWCSLFPHVRSHGHLWVWRSLLYLQGLCNEAVNESLADLFYNCQSSQKQPRISLTKIKAWFPISSFQILLDIDKFNQYFIYVPPKLVGTVLFIQEYYSSGLLFEKSSCTTGCSRFFNKWLCYRNKSTGEKVTWTWAEHNLSEDKWGDVGIWEKRMAPPCHHGWEKVQDNYGSIKAGASDGWKEFIRAPDKVKGGKCLCLHMS